MLCQLPRKDQANSGLDLAASHRWLLAVASKLGSLGGDFLELILDEGVQDRDGLGADAGVRVHLLQDLVDVDLRTAHDMSAHEHNRTYIQRNDLYELFVSTSWLGSKMAFAWLASLVVQVTTEFRRSGGRGRFAGTCDIKTSVCAPSKIRLLSSSPSCHRPSWRRAFLPPQRASCQQFWEP